MHQWLEVFWEFVRFSLLTRMIIGEVSWVESSERCSLWSLANSRATFFAFVELEFTIAVEFLEIFLPKDLPVSIFYSKKMYRTHAKALRAPLTVAKSTLFPTKLISDSSAETFPRCFLAL